jgi:hypothetical protein
MVYVLYCNSQFIVECLSLGYTEGAEQEKVQEGGENSKKIRRGGGYERK